MLPQPVALRPQVKPCCGAGHRACIEPPVTRAADADLVRRAVAALKQVAAAVVLHPAGEALLVAGLRRAARARARHADLAGGAGAALDDVAAAVPRRAALHVLLRARLCVVTHLEVDARAEVEDHELEHLLLGSHRPGARTPWGKVKFGVTSHGVLDVEIVVEDAPALLGRRRPDRRVERVVHRHGLREGGVADRHPQPGRRDDAVEVAAQRADRDLPERARRVEDLEPLRQRLALGEGGVDEPRAGIVGEVGHLVDVPVGGRGEGPVVEEPHVAVVRGEDAPAGVGVVDEDALGRVRLERLLALAGEVHHVVGVDRRLAPPELVLGGRGRRVARARHGGAAVEADAPVAAGVAELAVGDPDLAEHALQHVGEARHERHERDVALRLGLGHADRKGHARHRQRRVHAGRRRWGW